jgi:hypothetical protein
MELVFKLDAEPRSGEYLKTETAHYAEGIEVIRQTLGDGSKGYAVRLNGPQVDGALTFEVEDRRAATALAKALERITCAVTEDLYQPTPSTATKRGRYQAK